MSKIQAPKGTYDILPDGNPKDPWTVSANWQAIERIAREVAALYHFREIRTPIYEYTDLFHRGTGETTDIVRRETFTFTDRGGDSLTLRPEGTPGVVRAAVQHNLLADQGSRLKVFYIAPNFRYERPQRGRYHQHHQFGVEAFGIAQPEQDAECITLQMDFYRRCGVKDLSLRLNTLGDAESKKRYRDALVQFLEPRKSQLSEDSQRRLTENPLRILDSKDEKDVKAREGAPAAQEYLSEASQTHFARVQELLTQGSIPFVVDSTLVRGLDYYTNTVWEVIAGGLGAQNSMGGGGRYDNLVETLDGKPTPGVGFGSGLERLLIALEAQGVDLPKSSPPLVWLISLGDAARDANLKLIQELRQHNIPADMDPTGRSAKAQFKLADREGAAYAITVGETELSSGNVVLKNLKTTEQTAIARSEIVAHLQSLVTK